MDENPYQSPAIVATEPTVARRSGPGVVRSVLIALLLPLPIVGGMVGLIVGFFVALNWFSVDHGPPFPDLTDFGRTFLLLSGVAGFGLTAVLVSLAIRKLLGRE